MPTIKKGEAKEEYISRAIEHMIKYEGLSKEHAAGKAYGMWEQHLKKGKSVSSAKRRGR